MSGITLSYWQTAIVLLLSAMMILPFFWQIKNDGFSFTQSGYLLGSRKLPVISIALSLAGSWVWGPALLVTSQVAFQKGFGGAFWFIVPNIACFYILIPIARRIRKQYNGYTLAGFLSEKTQHSREVLGLFAIVTIAFQLCALVENSIAIRLMMGTVTPYASSATALVLFLFTALGVLLILVHGFKGSVITDAFQMTLMMLLCAAIFLFIYRSIPQEVNLLSGLGGHEGQLWNPFAWSIMLSPGIAMALGLIGGPMGDMMFFQRVMALPTEKDVRQTLSLAGVFFAIVPVSLSLPGFVAGASSVFTNANPESIGLFVTATLAPKIATIIFCVAIISGLFTTLISAYSAITAIAGRDFFEMAHRDGEEKQRLHFSWLIVILFATIAFYITISGTDLLPVFLTDAAIGSSMIVPIVYAAFAKKIRKQEILYPLILSFIFAVIFGSLGVIRGSEIFSAIAAPGAFLLGCSSLLLLRLSYLGRP